MHFRQTPYKCAEVQVQRMSQPKIKRRVGKYEVGRTIGEGTFAKVKFARNSETGEPVALKILDKEKVLKHKMAEQVECLTNLTQDFTLSLNLITLILESINFLHNCFFTFSKTRQSLVFAELILGGRLQISDASYYCILYCQLLYSLDSDTMKSSLLDVFNASLQIRREVATMKLIKHPNVVRLYEVSLSLSLWTTHVQ